jgi:two-component system response regulator AtoC
MSQRRIWLVNSNTNNASIFSEALFAEGYLAESIREKPVEFSQDHRPALIVLYITESSAQDLNVLIAARNAVPPIPVLAVVGPNQVTIAIEALKLGASDVAVEPLNPADLVSAVKKTQQKEGESPVLVQNQAYLNPARPDAAVFISRNEKMSEIWKIATMVARADVPVLILGESGVGKEILTRFIQRHSKRADHPLIKVNCAALPHDLLESELFGYERGAFTGAVGEKPGKFELANRGCLILDEIGEMAPNLQAKLLHVLEDGEFSRLGGRRSVKVDVRVLALTNRKLDEAIPRGEFREDLYFRLNVVKISIPPLRERKEDITLLCNYFLNRHREALGSSTKELPPEVIDAFLRYNWPGNVRELENAVRRYLILPQLDSEVGIMRAGEAREIDRPRRAFAAAASAAAISSASPGDSTHVVQFPSPGESIFLKSVAAKAADLAEREVVLRVLEQCNWNRRQAARRLNICYKSLLNKLKKWQVVRRRAS